MRARSFPQAVAFLAIAAALWACGWDQIDAVAALPDANAPDASLEDSAPAPDAPETDASSDRTSGPSLPCTSSTNPIQEWAFATSIDGWILTTDSGVKATLTWTGSTGDPMPGALQVDFTPKPSDAGALSGVWIHEEMNAANLTGRTVSAWVWLESGPSPEFLTFVQTATEYAWADNGVLHLTPRTWTCVSLDVSSPAYNQPKYDPTNVIRIGFEMLGAKPFRLYVDTVRYQ